MGPDCRDAARRHAGPRTAVPGGGRLTGRTAVLAGGWLAGAWLLARLPAPTRRPSPGASESGDDDSTGAGVLVVIPARNEAGAIGNLLASLATQTIPAAEIIVVDDRSTDATAAIADGYGARVLPGTPLPEGWTGKCWACHQGIYAGDGDVVVFLDADVTLAPDAIERLVDEHRREGGLVSVEPFHLVVRPYERLSAICNAVSLMGTGAFTPRAGRRTRAGRADRGGSMAFGPCLIVGRQDYRRSGGHAHPDVRDRVAEDIALARRFRAIGAPTRALAGRDMASFRMYPDGPAQLINGWTRVLGAGARSTRPLTAAGVALWVTAALMAASAPLAVLRGRPVRTALVTYGAFAAQVWWMLRRIGRFGALTSVLFPLPLSTFVAVFTRSVLRTVLRRPVPWRGRPVTPH